MGTGNGAGNTRGHNRYGGGVRWWFDCAHHGNKRWRVDIGSNKHSYSEWFYREYHDSKWRVSRHSSNSIHSRQWLCGNKNSNGEPAATLYNRLWRHVCGYDNDII